MKDKTELDIQAIAALRGLDQEALKGPWKVNFSDGSGPECITYNLEYEQDGATHKAEEIVTVIGWRGDPSVSFDKPLNVREVATLKLIAAMRNPLPALLDAAENPRDEHHTMAELYEHRHVLFLAFGSLVGPDRSWKSKLHADGTMFDGWFIAGINLPSGTITYHLPLSYWEESEWSFKELANAPEWDGHTSPDVIDRLRGYYIASGSPLYPANLKSASDAGQEVK